MKILRMTFKIVIINIKSILLLVIQMIVTSLILLALIGKIQYIMQEKDGLSIFNEDNAFYFTPFSYYDMNTFDMDSIIRKNISTSYEEGKISQLLLKNENGTNIVAWGYNDQIIHKSNIKMKFGKWFSKHNNTDYIPVVGIGDTYKTGTVINLECNSNKIQKALVIGTISRNTYIPTFNSYSSKGDASLTEIISLPYLELIIPFECSQVPSIQKNDIWDSQVQSSSILIFPSKVNKETVNESLGCYGAISNINEMTNNYHNEIKEFFITNGIALLIFSLLTLAGIGGVNSMINIKNERRYIIYYLCGFTSKGCAIVEGIRTSFMIALAYVILIILYYFTPLKSLYETNEVINLVTFLLTFIYLILVFCLSSLPFIINLGKKNLILKYKQKA
jgi:hypothetical protein